MLCIRRLLRLMIRLLAIPLRSLSTTIDDLEPLHSADSNRK
nr:hypothetical protein Q903MT_gene885 [Picea sitchensis]